MKNLIIVLLFLSPLYGHSQQPTLCQMGEYITDLFAEEGDGFVGHEESDEIMEMRIIQFPSFYTFDLVRIVVNRVVNEYSDIQIVRNWRGTDDPTYFELYLKVENKSRGVKFHYLLSYSTDREWLAVAWFP